MNVSCPQCHKRYRIDPTKIPAGKTSTRCPACKHRIPLKPAGNKSKPILQDTIKIECVGCNKVYNIPRDRLPANAKTLTCKECGEAIMLSGTISMTGIKAQEVISPPVDTHRPSRLEIIIEKNFTKNRIIATAIGFILFIIVVAFVPSVIRGISSLGNRVSNFVKENAQTYEDKKNRSIAHESTKRQTIPNPQKPETNISSPVGIQPILSLECNPSLLASVLASFPQTQPALETLKAIDTKQVNLWLCAKEQRLMPIVTLEADQPEVLHTHLSDAGQWTPYVEKTERHLYTLVEPNILQALCPNTPNQWESLPLEQYQIAIQDKQCMIVPKSLTEVILAQPELLDRSISSSYLNDVPHDESTLLSLALVMSPDQEKPWQNMVSTLATMLEAHTGVECPLRDDLRCLHMFDHLAFSFGIQTELERQLHYSLEFADTVDPCQPWSESIPEQHSLRRFANILSSHPFNSNNREAVGPYLTANSSWSPIQDPQILPLIQQVTFGTSTPTTSTGATNSLTVCAATQSFLNSLFRRTLVPQEDTPIQHLSKALWALKTIRNEKPRFYGEDIASLFFASDRRGQLMELIPHDLAIADPIHTERYGYQVQPYHGYHIKPITTRAYTEQSLGQWRRLSGQRITWMECKDKQLTVASVPNLIAVPVSHSDPTLIYVAETDTIYLNYTLDQPAEIKYLPPDMFTNPAWIQVDTQDLSTEIEHTSTTSHTPIHGT